MLAGCRFCLQCKMAPMVLMGQLPELLVVLAQIAVVAAAVLPVKLLEARPVAARMLFAGQLAEQGKLPAAAAVHNIAAALLAAEWLEATEAGLLRLPRMQVTIKLCLF